MSSPSRILKLACPILAVAVIVLGLHAFQHESLAPVRQRFAEIKLWDSIPDRGFLCEGYESGTKQEAMGVLGEFGQRDCSMCAASPELCARIGEKQLAKSQAYFGTGDRMKRFLAKAKSGEGFNVGVIGGSVSHGHGLSDLRGDKLSHLLIFEHLDKLFPAREGSSIGSYEPGKNSFINGAVPAMGSDYYAWCFPSHIPPDTDLVLLELGVNDELQIQRLDSYEMLLRGLLDLPNSPAILALHVPALSFGQIALGGDVHFGPAQFYDVPMLSMRNAIMDDIFANHSLTDYYFAHNKIGTDTRHIGPIGHRLLGELGTAYINSQLCEMDRSGMSGLAAEDIPVPPVPRMRLMSKYDADTVIPSLTPFCRSANAHGDFKLTPTKVDGWREFESNDKHFLIADVPGSTVQFEFTTTLGSVDIGYLRSRVYGLGNAECWVDDDRAKAVTLKGYWGHDVNIAQRLTIRSDLKPGSYVMHCELLDKTDDPSGAKEFRLISLMSM